jgi:hypothetical protein
MFVMVYCSGLCVTCMVLERSWYCCYLGMSVMLSSLRWGQRSEFVDDCSCMVTQKYCLCLSLCVVTP